MNSDVSNWLWEQPTIVVVLSLIIYFIGREYLLTKREKDLVIREIQKEKEELTKDLIRVLALWENKWSLDNDSDVESKNLIREILELLKKIESKVIEK